MKNVRTFEAEENLAYYFLTPDWRELHEFDGEKPLPEDANEEEGRGLQ